MHEGFTNRQIALIAFSTIVGYGIVTLPKNAVENAGSAAWLAIAIATVIAALSIYAMTYLGYTHQNMTLPDYSQILVGKFFTLVFLFMYILYYFTLFTLILKNVGEDIRQTIIIRTPPWVIILTFLIVAFYLATKKLKVIALVCEYYGVIIIVSIVIICILLFTQGNILNMKPFLGSRDILTYLKASSAVLLPFLGVEVITLVPIGKKNGKKVFKYTSGAVVSVGIIYILIVEASIAVRGTDMIIRYEDTLIEIIRSIDIPYLEFLQRLDGLFLITWIMTVFTTAAVYFYAVVFLLSKCFRKANFNTIAFVVMVISFFTSLIPLTTEKVGKFLDYASYFGIVTVVFIPMLLIIITKVKKHEKK